MRRLWEIVTWPASAAAIAIGRLPAATGRAAGQQALVVRDNIRHRRAIEERPSRRDRPANAKSSSPTPISCPGAAFAGPLRCRTSRRADHGIFQGKVEYRLQHFATQALTALLEAGIRVFEYRRSFLHAKVAVIDGQWATVGSSNIDPSACCSPRKPMSSSVTATWRPLHTSLHQVLAADTAELRRRNGDACTGIPACCAGPVISWCAWR